MFNPQAAIETEVSIPLACDVCEIGIVVYPHFLIYGGKLILACDNCYEVIAEAEEKEAGNA